MATAARASGAAPQKGIKDANWKRREGKAERNPWQLAVIKPTPAVLPSARGGCVGRDAGRNGAGGRRGVETQQERKALADIPKMSYQQTPRLQHEFCEAIKRGSINIETAAAGRGSPPPEAMARAEAPSADQQLANVATAAASPGLTAIHVPQSYEEQGFQWQQQQDAAFAASTAALFPQCFQTQPLW
eukprot:gene25504-8743_t